MKPLYRLCPSCSEKIEYKTREGCRTGERKNSTCRSCATKEDYKNNPNKNKGDNNGRYGKSLENLMLLKYNDNGEKYKTWLMNLNKFKCGEENPQYGKPGWKNSGMSYKGWYKGLFFRSSFELIFIHDYYKEKNNLPISAESDNFKVNYFINDKKYNYHPDFYCPIENKVYEVKCEKFTKTDINMIKSKEAIIHFNKVGINYEVITEKKLDTFKHFKNWKKIIDTFLFNLFINNEVKLTDISLLKLKKKISKNKEKLKLINNYDN